MAEECTAVGDGEYLVKSGDSICSIADAAGHLPDTIWNDPANSGLKEARKDGEVLLPGDRLTVVARRRKDVACATGKLHVFRRAGAVVTVSIIVEDEEGKPFAGKKYELAVEGTTYSGTTADDGKIECKIPSSSSEGMLRVWLEEPGLPNPWIREVRLGYLYPIEHTLGIQQRLSNLGFYPGELDGEAGPGTRAAVAAFQAAQQLAVGEEIDQATRDKLVEIHRV